MYCKICTYSLIYLDHWNGHGRRHQTTTKTTTTIPTCLSATHVALCWWGLCICFGAPSCVPDCRRQQARTAVHLPPHHFAAAGRPNHSAGACPHHRPLCSSSSSASELMADARQSCLHTHVVTDLKITTITDKRMFSSLPSLPEMLTVSC